MDNSSAGRPAQLRTGIARFWGRDRRSSPTAFSNRTASTTTAPTSAALDDTTRGIMRFTLKGAYGALIERANSRPESLQYVQPQVDAIDAVLGRGAVSALFGTSPAAAIGPERPSTAAHVGNSPAAHFVNPSNFHDRVRGNAFSRAIDMLHDELSSQTSAGPVALTSRAVGLILGTRVILGTISSNAQADFRRLTQQLDLEPGTAQRFAVGFDEAYNLAIDGTAQSQCLNLSSNWTDFGNPETETLHGHAMAPQLAQEVSKVRTGGHSSLI